MHNPLIVVDDLRDFRWQDPNRLVITARDYIARGAPDRKPRRRVINLCRDYEYLSLGYYCSLLAEARGDRPLPSMEAMLDVFWRRLQRHALPELDEQIGKDLRAVGPGGSFTLNVFFGVGDDPRLQELARRAFDQFHCPLLALECRHSGTWKVSAVKPLSIRQLKPEQEGLFEWALDRYLRIGARTPKPRPQYRYDLAILHDPAERLPPSDAKALARFVKAGESLDMAVDLITRKDFGRLAEFDALFIRETTNLDHHTYRFAKKAAAEGMVVIDDPASIVRCTNKVYLAELLRANKLLSPRTAILQRGQLDAAIDGFDYPVVLKIPDGSFSRGVEKAASHAEYVAIAEVMLKQSDVILVQEYMYTDYDWRVGVLNGEPLFVCQYFMSKDHWQIVNHKGGGTFTEGNARTLGVEDAPAEVVRTAVTAARLIGDGLYGVDLKQNDKGVHIIEINDNPNLDAGVEDAILKDELYRRIIGEFVRRLELRTRAGVATRGP